MVKLGKNEKKKIQIILESLRLIKIVNIKNITSFIVRKYTTADKETLKPGVFNTVVINSIRFLLEIVMVVIFLLLILSAFINNYNINDLFAYLIFGVFFVRLLPSVNKLIVLINKFSYYGKSLDTYL